MRFCDLNVCNPATLTFLMMPSLVQVNVCPKFERAEPPFGVLKPETQCVLLLQYVFLLAAHHVSRQLKFEVYDSYSSVSGALTY
jgi:hypothetical protein